MNDNKLIKYRKVRNLLFGDQIFITHPKTGKIVKAIISNLKQEYPSSNEPIKTYWAGANEKQKKIYRPGCMSFTAHIAEGHPEIEAHNICVYANPNDLIPQPF